ncbi:hypothetical protein ATO6_18765 [Oceanicola sp. 22II-s10i]|uniref:GumC family protein n=1 Tax=Oceanicola sp. 22II-s10i TaxID=1317116 RepID=UPI000B725099|nr:polysaccharide biosynthesis tyrosine autokinase [Oceanicola sp. 22II-s10i]OWU83480.1 hypothetical protein ATO6_18765 [Oceanicola sp. 22II-s10i]
MTDIFDRGPIAPRRMASAAADDSVDVRAVARGVWFERKLILSSTLVFGLLAAGIALQMTPTFTSVSQVLLDPRERRVMTDEQVVSDLKLNDQVVASELSIMRSNLLLENVIDSIDAQQPGALDLIDPAAEEPGIVARMKSGIKSLFVSQTEETPEAEELARLERAERLTWAIRKHLTTWRDGEAFVISIKAETIDAQLSALIAATVADQYVSQQLDGRRRSATQAADWIEQRVAELHGQVQDAEDAVEEYRARSLASNGTSADILSQRILSLNEELIKARVERVATRTRYDEMARLIREGGYEALGSMFTSVTIEELANRRVEIMASDAEWARRFDERHPERRKLADKLEEVNRALSAEYQRALDALQNEVKIAEIREQTIRESLEEAETQAIDMSRDSIGLRQLERQADAARRMYTELLDRYTETRTQEQLQQADARIIERATVAGAPSAPRPKLITLLGLVFGALVGLGVAGFRQLSTRSYRSSEELVHDTGLPVLASVPERQWRSLRQAMREVDEVPMGPVVEAMRKLRTELGLSDDAGEPQSVALLSPLQEEGKTTTTLLLARVAELSNKLVCVIDCDFRKNTIQSELKLPMQNDLIDLMRGDCDLLEAVQTDAGRGFDLLASRTTAPGAADMISTEWLSGVLDELKQYYDVILVNCPAILPVAETLVLARAVDQRVMLVRHDSTSRAALRRALAMLDHNGLDLSGQVMTRVEPKMAEDDIYSYEY